MVCSLSEKNAVWDIRSTLNMDNSNTAMKRVGLTRNSVFEVGFEFWTNRCLVGIVHVRINEFAPSLHIQIDNSGQINLAEEISNDC